MNLIDMSFRRNSFELEIKYSILFECALGIAIITYPKLHGNLDQPQSYWHFLRNGLSEKLESELHFCQKHNSWKMLLQLLHERDFRSIDDFLSFIEELDAHQLKYKVLPYLDQSQQNNRLLASKGDEKAINEMILACKDHLFFPQMIDFIGNVNPFHLRKHLISLMEGWYKEVITQDEKGRIGILKRDVEEKRKLEKRLSPEEIVQWATGVEYHPEVDITKILLIPHYIYRPWTIQATIEGTKVFYYPVSDESLSDDDDINLTLVQLYKALGDEKRLRIIKLLFEKNRSLKELTELVGIGKTTVHHHLALLRAAHIVKVSDSSYSLNRYILKTHENQLWTYLENKR